MRDELPAVEKRLPPQVEGFVHEEHDLRRLENPPRRGREQHLRHALGQAVGVGLFFPVDTRGPLVVERLRPGLEWDLFLQVAPEIPQISGRRIPDAREVRGAVGHSRCGRREVRLPVRCQWNLRRGDVRPLRQDRRRQKGHEDELQECSHVSLPM
jgi:hypothetical protein